MAGGVDSDSDEYYTQGFERDGVVSVWVGLEPVGPEDAEVDVLQDLCGVGYYRLDDQEANARDEPVPLAGLLGELSYAASFAPAARAAAAAHGIDRVAWVVVQFDFAYDPARALRAVAAEPVFLGVFAYDTAASA